MKGGVLALTILLFAASSPEIVEFPQSLRSYTTWQRITPDKYSVPGQLSILCTLPAHQGEVVDEDAQVRVRVFANPVALTSVFTKDPFPEGSILIKEKQPGPLYASTIHQGVMTKTKKGWEFSFYPYYKGATFDQCAACHSTAEHDFVFTPYLKKK
jgi:hypothetical protein